MTPRKIGAGESQDQLVGGVAHDLNNLLNVISGYADFTADQLTSLAKEDRRLEPVLADVEQIRTAARQAILVARQLLTFSTSETTITNGRLLRLSRIRVIS